MNCLRPSHPSKRIRLALLWVSLLAVGASRVGAQEAVVPSYPLLPEGYTSIRVFDRGGRFVGRLLPDQRYWVPIDRIPSFLKQAVVAVEDARFFQHNGIDVRGIARALVTDVVKGRLAEGGSTITQQLVKVKYLSSEKTIDRKLDEARLALELEKRHSKAQILEMYLNEIYYGNGAWGIAQAARLYFDKSPQELTDAECTLLAGVPKAPSVYNPLGAPAKVATRRDVVLKRMVDVGMITRARQQELRAHPALVLQPGRAPEYLGRVRSRLLELYGPKVVEQGGMEVTAALDLTMQEQAERLLAEGVKKLSPDLQGALLCVDPSTGDVLAAVGGVDAGRGSYDRVFVSRRQPGSAVKPFLYAAALERGYTASTQLDDEPVAYRLPDGRNWEPRNFGGKSYGTLTLREALAYSDNVIAVKLLDALGISPLVDFAERVGLPMHARGGLSLALGTEDTSLAELVLAYAPFAGGGARPEARLVLRVYDRRRLAWTEYPTAAAPVLSPEVAYVTTEMLKDVLRYGTAKGLRKFAAKRPAAGKTGTTDDSRDAWFVGYTPQLVTGIWVGYDKPRPGGRNFTGGAVAAPIWERFMATALAGTPAVDFPRPPDVVTVAIDPTTGCRAPPGAAASREENYLPGTEPTEDCAGPPPPGEPEPPPAVLLPESEGEAPPEGAAPAPQQPLLER